MSKTQIGINQITIRGRGIAPRVAQAAVQGLGQELLTGLTQQRDALGVGQRIQIDDLNLGTIQVSNTQDTNQLRQAIAASVLQAIARSAPAKPIAKRCCLQQIAANLKTSDRR